MRSPPEKVKGSNVSSSTVIANFGSSLLIGLMTKRTN